MSEPDRTAISMDTFRIRFSSLLDAHGYSIKGLSDRIGITRATLSRYLDGKRQPELIYVMKIARFFHVSLDWLLGMSDEKFDGAPEELMQIMTLYSVASDGDKHIVRAILSKYRKEGDRYD